MTDKTEHRVGRSLYEPLDWVLVRAPTLPVEAYLGIAGDAATHADPIRALDHPLIRTAIAVASPDLLEAVGRPETSDRRGRGKLLRYLIRMSTRPTPFGLFAGVGLARIGETTDLRSDSTAPRTRMRPDMAWLLTLVARLEERAEIRRDLHVFSNQSTWVHDGRALLPERAAIDGEDSGPVSIRATGAVCRALEFARTPIRWTDLVAEIMESSGAPQETVDELITNLWRLTFLLTDLRPPLTHPAPGRYVERRLAGIPAAKDEHVGLTAVLEAMQAWDGLDQLDRPAALRRLRKQATVVVPTFDGAQAQVDSALTLGADTLATSVGDKAARAAELLLRVSPPYFAGNLETYYRSFVNRYGVDREVGLLELLDPVRGLGPPVFSSQSTVEPGKLAIRQATLRQLAVNALRDGRLAVELDEAAIAKLEATRTDTNTVPISVDLSAFVVAHSAAEVDRGEFRLMVGPNLGAQAAGRNLGRFADLLGKSASDALSAVAAIEIAHHPESVHAELVHLPLAGRSANVAVRPSFYDYEIVAGTTANVDATRSIPLAEILVGVRDRRFYARWPGAPGDLHVHASHMLTSRAAPEAFRFLEEVTRGGRTTLLPFNWGSVGDLPFLPRIEADRIVLSPAQWRIDALMRDSELRPDDQGFEVLLERWRVKWSVPRTFYLTERDNRLLLDLASPEHVEQLRDELRRLDDDEIVLLQEPLPGPEHAWLTGPEGHHIPEFVFPLARCPQGTEAPRADSTSSAALPSRADRLRPPGSDWLYVKVYGLGDEQDELLADEVRNLGEFAIGSGLAAGWFFLRYADPAPHLRVRFTGEPGRLLGTLLPHVARWGQDLIAQCRCSSFAFDTYEREIERYGGLSAIAVAEEIFTVDSETVVELLDALRGGKMTLDRTELAVVSVDALLHALGLDVARRVALYRMTVETKRESGDEYRRRKAALRRLLHDQDANSQSAQVVSRILRARHAAVAPLAQRLHALTASGECTKPIDSICSSFVHLHCNRLLGAEKPTEQLLLGLLLRTREGLLRAPIVRNVDRP